MNVDQNVNPHGQTCLCHSLPFGNVHKKKENLLQEIKVTENGRDNDFMYYQELDVFWPTPTTVLMKWTQEAAISSRSTRCWVEVILSFSFFLKEKMNVMTLLVL